MAETGMGGGKRNGSASIPREVPSNFSAVVAPMTVGRQSCLRDSNSDTEAASVGRPLSRLLCDCKLSVLLSSLFASSRVCDIRNYYNYNHLTASFPGQPG